MHISYLHNCYRWQSLTCLQSEASKSLALQKEKSRTKTQQLVDFLRNTARWRSTQSWLETSEMLSIQVILSCPCVGWVEPLLNFDTKRDFWDLAGSPSNPPTNPMNESMIKTMTIIMTTSKVRNLNVRAASFFYSSLFCDTGRTKSVEWRKEQLRAVDRFETQFSQLSASWKVEPTRMLVENEAAFISALKTDLNKPLQETIMAEIDFLRLFLSTQRRHFLSIYTYLMPLMPGMTLLVFYEKLTTGPKTREDPFSTFSYPSILFLPILKSPPRYVPKSPLTLLDTVLTHPEPYGVVLVIGDIP